MKISEISKLSLRKNSSSFNNVDKRLKFGIVGVGGGGSNAVFEAWKKLGSISSLVDFVVINTDIQALKKPGMKDIIKMLIGESTTKGLGSGGKYEVGKAAAKESSEKIRKFIQGKHVIFLSAGLGGGTGSGAAPEVARIAKEEGVLVISFGTLPWRFEGAERYKNALISNHELGKVSDSLILFDNESFLSGDKVSSNESLSDLFKEINDNFIRTIITLIDLVYDSSLINVDFNDIKSTLTNSGFALFNSIVFRDISLDAERTEKNITIIRETFEQKFNSRLSILKKEELKIAKNIILNISGSEKILKMVLVKEIINGISKITNDKIEYIFGVSHNEFLGDKIKISYLITGLNDPMKIEYEKLMDKK
ncbi:MAG: hypothetical protein GQ557_00200 [Mycoplasmataceae bacterium]|nr:hypothetical protein [Mycoplasmataceae bacterium]